MPHAERNVIPFKNRTQRLKFSKRSLADIEPPKTGRVYVYDSSKPSLALCVTATGKRTFYLVRKIEGRTVRLRLGAFPQISVEQARDLIDKNNAKIADGGNPQADRQAARGESTFAEAFGQYLEQHARPHKKSWEHDQQRHDRHLKAWGNRKLSSITGNDVRGLHAKLGTDNGRHEANRTLALLSVVFSFAGECGWTGRNPCVGVKKFSERSRDRFLQADEFPRFWKAVDEDQSPDFRDFFRLALLTGARVGNLMAAEWSHLLLDDGVWRIPETKSGEWQRVHLPELAVTILRDRLKRLQAEAAVAKSDPSPFVFPSRAGTKRGYVTDITKPWKRITEAARLDDLRPHDLRRTLGSWQAATGASLPIIGKSLGHRGTAATSIYARLNLDPVKAAVDTAVAAMMATTEGGKR
jgi:integrase